MIKTCFTCVMYAIYQHDIYNIAMAFPIRPLTGHSNCDISYWTFIITTTVSKIYHENGMLTTVFIAATCSP